MTTKTHFSEADLLETYYMQPEETAPVMLHLAKCDDCLTRYNRLELKLRQAAACPTKPETFYSRQRLSIMRRIAAHPARVARIGAATRIAAAATLAFVLGGAVVYHQNKLAGTPTADKTPITSSAAVKAVSVEAAHEPINPWESEELKEYHGVVQWESWLSDGDESL